MVNVVGILHSINPDNVSRDHFSNCGTHRLKEKNLKNEKIIGLCRALNPMTGFGGPTIPNPGFVGPLNPMGHN